KKLGNDGPCMRAMPLAVTLEVVYRGSDLANSYSLRFPIKQLGNDDGGSTRNDGELFLFIPYN
uniref:hypothetical protein n=1 Tax=Psychromonas sp. Urea-02u-13 TaxID=2058326 RepID=UPI001E5CCB80